MRKIEITTAHNIVVSHELASIGQRALAAIIDLVIVYFYAMLMGIVIGSSTVLSLLLIFPVVMCYHLVSELFNEGQSIGKKVLKIRVVSIEGMAPTTQDILMRWLFRFMDIGLSMGILAIISASTSTRNQRFGDVMARTAVINLKASRQFDLNKLKNLETDPDSIRYPAVIQYSDADMLLVKQTLIRHQKAPSEATREIVTTLRARIIDDLGLDKEPILQIRATKFLKQILQEYILLTR